MLLPTAIKYLTILRMAEPLVSVVIPSYNRSQYIAETIESVLTQTYRNIEVIVIDDGSTDNTSEVVDRYLPRIKYVRQNNSERGASRNHGLRLANGDFISFLDSDDLWLPEKLAKDIEIFDKSPKAGIVYSDVVLIDASGKLIKLVKRHGYSGRVTEQLLVDNFVSIGAHLIRTTVVRDIGGFREERKLSGSEDWEMWVRLSKVTDFAYHPNATTKIRTHDANTMGDVSAMKRSMNEAIAVMEASDYLNYDQKKLITRSKAMVELVNAINYCTARNKKQALYSLHSSLKLDPRIVADLRFGYTILRLIFGNKITTSTRT